MPINPALLEQLAGISAERENLMGQIAAPAQPAVASNGTALAAALPAALAAIFGDSDDLSAFAAGGASALGEANKAAQDAVTRDEYRKQFRLRLLDDKENRVERRIDRDIQSEQFDQSQDLRRELSNKEIAAQENALNTRLSAMRELEEMKIDGRKELASQKALEQIEMAAARGENDVTLKLIDVYSRAGLLDREYDRREDLQLNKLQLQEREADLQRKHEANQQADKLSSQLERLTLSNRHDEALTMLREANKASMLEASLGNRVALQGMRGVQGEERQRLINEGKLDVQDRRSETELLKQQRAFEQEVALQSERISSNFALADLANEAKRGNIKEQIRGTLLNTLIKEYGADRRTLQKAQAAADLQASRITADLEKLKISEANDYEKLNKTLQAKMLLGVVRGRTMVEAYSSTQLNAEHREQLKRETKRLEELRKVPEGALLIEGKTPPTTKAINDFNNLRQSGVEALNILSKLKEVFKEDGSREYWVRGNIERAKRLDKAMLTALKKVDNYGAALSNLESNLAESQIPDVAEPYLGTGVLGPLKAIYDIRKLLLNNEISEQAFRDLEDRIKTTVHSAASGAALRVVDPRFNLEERVETASSRRLREAQERGLIAR